MSETSMTLAEAVAHLDRCSYADTDDVCGAAISVVRDHARDAARALAAPQAGITREAVIEAVQRVDVIERSDLNDAWRPASRLEAHHIADAVGLTDEPCHG